MNNICVHIEDFVKYLTINIRDVDRKRIDYARNVYSIEIPLAGREAISIRHELHHTSRGV